MCCPLLIPAVGAQPSSPEEGGSPASDTLGTAVYFEGRLHYGFIIIHSRDIRAIEDSYPWGFEVDFGKYTASQAVWDRCNCNLRRGWSLGFWDFDNRQVLGAGVTGQYFIEPEFRVSKKLRFSVRGAMGLSYQNRPHDPVTNPENLSYSTRIAFPLTVGITARKKLSPHWQVHLSGRYNHISNGSIRQPNKGINWPTLAAGLSYSPHPIADTPREKKPWRSLGPPQRRKDITAIGSFDKTGNRVLTGIGGAEVKYSAQVARLSALTIATEWGVHGSYPLREGGERSFSGQLLGGIATGHEFLLGKFIFSQQFGFYLHKPPNEPRDVYQRYGLVYRATEHWGTGIGFKAHGHVADFIDLRITRFL